MSPPPAFSARRAYSELLDLGNQSPYDSYAGRSLARQVDVALNTGRVDTLPGIAQQAARITTRDATGSFDYALGKLSFARGELAEARRLLASVGAQSPYHHQAQYVLGTMLIKQALAESGAGSDAEAQARLVLPGAARRFEPAISQFRHVTELPADHRFFEYQRTVNAGGVPSEDVIDRHCAEFQGEYRDVTEGPHPVESLREDGDHESFAYRRAAAQRHMLQEA